MENYVTSNIKVQVCKDEHIYLKHSHLICKFVESYIDNNYIELITNEFGNDY